VEYDTIKYDNPSNIGVEIATGDCYQSIITVDEDLLIGEVNIMNFQADAENVHFLDVTLISPEGKEITLFNEICDDGDSDININLNDHASTLDFAPCNPLGGGGTYKPQEALKNYYRDNMMGDWTLQIANNSCNPEDRATVNSWELQLMGMQPYSQGDTLLSNDKGQCGAEFCWIHPILEDNCCEGMVIVEYIPVDPPDLPVPRGGEVPGGREECQDFSVGRTLVKYTLVDQYGNESMCSFEVGVIDDEPPIITNCPGDQIIHLDCGLCDVVWDYNYKGTDNCSVDTIEVHPPNGTLFPIGDTEVCVIIRDGSGNLDSCKYTVTVKEYIPLSNELSCVDDINLSLGSDCQAILNADMILEGCNHRCYDNYILQITEGCGNGRPGPAHNDTFGLADVGKCFTVTVIDPVSGNSCWGCVCIEEKLLPEILCPPDDTISCIEPWGPEYLGYAELETCEPNATLSYVDSLVDFGACVDFRAMLFRIWSVTDDDGHKVSCTQTIAIEQFDLADISFPRNYDNLDLPALSCNEAKTTKNLAPHIIDFPYCVDGYLLDSARWFATGGDLNLPAGPARDLSGDRLPMSLGWNTIDNGPGVGLPSPHSEYYNAHPQWQFFGVCWGPEERKQWIGTGVPTINGISVYEDARYCELSVKYDDEIYEICEDGYGVLRHWKIWDMCQTAQWGINPIIHIQTIKVLDKEGPEIVYPDEVTVGTSPWDCSGYWEVPEPWFNDNCSGEITYQVIVRDGRAIQRNDGSWYIEGIPLGKNRVIIEASDACGNLSQHTIIVTAVDDTPPVAICKDKLQISLSGNQSPGSNFVAICADELDKASYDNCTQWIWYKMIRMDELLGTVNGSFADNTEGCGGVNGDDDGLIAGNQVYYDDCSKFCCDDADQVINVVLRIHDVDPGAGAVHPSRYTPPAGDLVGHFTDCWVEIEVVDKAQPLVVAPPDVVVSCMFWFDDSEAALSDIDNPTFGRVVTSLTDRQKVKTLDIVCEEWCEDHPKYDYEPSRNRPAIWTQACDYYNAYYNDAHPDDKYELVWGYDGYAIQTCGAQPEIRVDDRRECGQGVILRDVIVTYQDAKTGGVVTYRDRQEIWVIDCDPFWVSEDCFEDEDCIEWPRFCQQPDPLDGCGANLDPYTNPDLGYPAIANGCDDNCALIAIDYQDDLYTIEDTACFKVVRTWVVIDWCTYDPLAPQTRDGDNPNQVSDGRWEFVQVIVVRDQIDPEVTVEVGDCEPAEKDVNDGICYGHLELCATATDDCSPDTWLVYDYKIEMELVSLVIMICMRVS
jgi:subtilisin-like proprotein convertase family protein